MVGFGARQQEIIKHFFKTKQFPALKLWGKILSKLQHDADAKIAWSSVSLKDFEESNAVAEHVGGIIDELMTSVPNTNIIILLTERESNVISGSIRTKKGVDSALIAKLFGGGGHYGAAGFKILDMSSVDAESMVISKIKEYQKKTDPVLTTISDNQNIVDNSSKSTETPNISTLDKNQ